MRERKRSFTVLVLVLALATTGCPRDPYRAAIQGSDDVAQAVSQAIPFIAQYYSAGKLTDAEKAQAGEYLTAVTNGNMTFRHAVLALHNKGVTGVTEYVTLAQAFVISIPTDPRTFNYKSKEAQDQFKTVLGAVKAALDGIVVVLQNVKAKGA